MKKHNFKFALLIVLFAFQLACRQTQSVFDNGNQSKSENANQTTLNSAINDFEEKKKGAYYFAHLKPEHKEVLQEWLKTKSYLRPAIEESDSILDKTALGNIHKDNQTQFYTVADINRDGKEDFAVLLVDTEKNDKFAIAIFNGKLSKGQMPNHFEDNLNRLSDSYLKYMREKNSDNYFSSNSYLLLSGYPDSNQDSWGCLGFIPKGNTYKTVICI